MERLLQTRLKRAFKAHGDDFGYILRNWNNAYCAGYVNKGLASLYVSTNTAYYGGKYAVRYYTLENGVMSGTRYKDLQIVSETTELFDTPYEMIEFVSDKLNNAPQAG